MFKQVITSIMNHAHGWEWEWNPGPTKSLSLITCALYHFNNRVHGAVNPSDTNYSFNLNKLSYKALKLSKHFYAPKGLDRSKSV